MRQKSQFDLFTNSIKEKLEKRGVTLAEVKTPKGKTIGEWIGLPPLPSWIIIVGIIIAIILGIWAGSA